MLTRFEYKRRKNERLVKDLNANPAKFLSKEIAETQISQMVGLWTAALAESKFTLERLKYVNQRDI